VFSPMRRTHLPAGSGVFRRARQSLGTLDASPAKFCAYIQKTDEPHDKSDNFAAVLDSGAAGCYSMFIKEGLGMRGGAVP
jgi:hypothetical protein